MGVLMSVPPLIPLHIIYDNAVINEDIFLKNLAKLHEYMKANVEDKKHVRLSLTCLGSLASGLDLKDRQVDLFGAFTQVMSIHRNITQGIGNPEVLILLGTRPSVGWQSVQAEIETEARSVILTYWFEKGTLSANSTSLALDDLLKKISRPDPSNPSPRHKVVLYETGTDIEKALVDVFQKLAGRLDWRLSNVGRIVEIAL